MVLDSQSSSSLQEANNRDLAQRNERLERNIADLRAMTRCLAHDLRAPLHSITGFARMLEINDAVLMSQHGRRRLARILACSAEMEATIDGFLGASIANAPEDYFGLVDVDRIVRELLRSLSGLYESADIAVAALPEIMADPPLVRQVFANVIENALKFSSTQEAQRVEIGCAHIEGGAVFFVRDNGVGFPPDTADLLFEPFRRPGAGSPFAGDGFGLSIAKRFVERHGGWICAESVTGATTFTFAFGAHGRPALL